MTNAAIYCRVSTETQKEKGYSLNEQDLICGQYILEKQYTFVDRVHEDISGTTYERPEMDRIIQLARSKAIDVLICMELDRFARGPVPMVMLESQLKKLGVKVEYALNQFEDSPIGDFMKTVAAGVAELERQKIIERMMRGKNGKARSGKVVQSPNPPYGYFFSNDSYDINKLEAQVVQDIYKWYVEEGLGYVAIANRLTERQVPTRSDSSKFGARRKKANGVWNMSTVRNILNNRVYIGEFTWGKNQKEQIIIPVPAIIEKSLFSDVQTRKTNNVRFNRRNAVKDYMLTGMMYCKTCGERFYGLTKNKDGAIRYYRCGSQVPDHKPYPGYVSACPQKYVKADEIEGVIWDAVVQALKEPERISEGLRKKREAYAADGERRKTQTSALEEQIKKIDKQEKRLLDLYLENNFAREVLQSKSSELKAVRNKLEAELTKLQEDVAPEFMTNADIGNFERYCRKIAKGLDKYTLQQKRSTLKLLQLKVLLDKRDGCIEITGLLGDLIASYFGYMQYCLIPNTL